MNELSYPRKQTGSNDLPYTPKRYTAHVQTFPQLLKAQLLLQGIWPKWSYKQSDIRIAALEEVVGDGDRLHH